MATCYAVLHYRYMTVSASIARTYGWKMINLALLRKLTGFHSKEALSSGASYRFLHHQNVTETCLGFYYLKYRYRARTIRDQSGCDSEGTFH